MIGALGGVIAAARGVWSVLSNPWILIGIGVAMAGSFIGGMQVQKKFFAAAEKVALERHIDDLQADSADDAKLIEELNNDARKHGRTFQNVEDRSSGDSCLVFDDDSLRLLNGALGYPEVQPPRSKPVSGSGATPAPG